jgi:hypothetical protein
MTEYQNNMSILTKQVVDKRIMGLTIEETAAEVGISVEEAVIEWRNYVSSRVQMPKEEQWVLHLLRVENLLHKANIKLESSQFLEDFEVVLKILDRIEALQSLNHSRKEVAELEADKLHRLQAEQLLAILETSKLMMRGMIEEAFDNAKTLKAAKASLLEDLGEYTNKALDQLDQTAAVTEMGALR